LALAIQNQEKDMDPYIGEIRIFAGNFAPRGWALCNGQILSIAQNTALFSLLGTTYGGNGQTTFALPDLQGRLPMHPGNGPGLTPRTLGETSGTETVTLILNQIPSHTHQPRASTEDANSATPLNATWALASNPMYRPDDGVAMAPNALAQAGSGQPHNNLQPYLVVNFIIALQGVYPPRS
jgi:microcystin-dependent protein